MTDTHYYAVGAEVFEQYSTCPTQKLCSGVIIGQDETIHTAANGASQVMRLSLLGWHWYDVLLGACLGVRFMVEGSSRSHLISTH